MDSKKLEKDGNHMLCMAIEGKVEYLKRFQLPEELLHLYLEQKMSTQFRKYLVVASYINLSM